MSSHTYSANGHASRLPDVEVVRVTPERLDRAAGVMGRAFANDPMMLWVLGGDRDDRAFRERATTEYFRIVNEDNVRNGWVWETADGSGVAVWLPPEATETFAEDDLITRPAIGAICDDGGARNDAFWDWLNTHIPSEPLWFLDQIGVDPGFQGRGVGTALIRHGLAEAEAANVGAYLETGNPANVALYLRLGFRVISDEDPPGGGPHIWFMRT